MATCKKNLPSHVVPSKKQHCWVQFKLYIVPVWIQLNVAFTFCIFRLFFSLRVNSNITWFYYVGNKNTIHALFMYCSRTVYGSHDTIHTFKNYFVTVFSVFNFSKNKFNPNGPIKLNIISRPTLFIGFFFFFFGKQPHTREREIGFNTKAHHKLHSKAIKTFKRVWDKLFYTQHTTSAI